MKNNNKYSLEKINGVFSIFKNGEKIYENGKFSDYEFLKEEDFEFIVDNYIGNDVLEEFYLLNEIIKFKEKLNLKDFNVSEIKKEINSSIENRVLKLRKLFGREFMSSKNRKILNFDFVLRKSIEETKEKYEFFKNEDGARKIIYKVGNNQKNFNN